MIKEINPHVSMMIQKQNEHCEVWKERDTLQSLDARIIEEGIEMYQEMQKCLIGGPPEFLLSEIGDVLYLYEKRKLSYPEEPLSTDVSGVIYCAHYLCELTGENPNKPVIMKWARNDEKYPRSLGNSGLTPDQYERLCKLVWRFKGGDEVFYLIWEAVGEQFIQQIPNLLEAMA